MIRNKLFIAVLGLLTTLLVSTYYLGIYNGKSKQAFVNNISLFQEYEGRKESVKALESLTKRHEYLLDSMKTTIAAMPDNSSEELQAKKEKIIFFQQVTSDFQQEEENTAAKYHERVWKQLNQYVYDYGKENGFDYIHGAQQNGGLMYADKSADITEELINYANEKYSGK